MIVTFVDGTLEAQVLIAGRVGLNPSFHPAMGRIPVLLMAR
jgi:hypothetical protein